MTELITEGTNERLPASSFLLAEALEIANRYWPYRYNDRYTYKNFGANHKIKETFYYNKWVEAEENLDKILTTVRRNV